MPYYVTTPIYYVNGEPHLGHAYTTIAADVLARHMRQRGEQVFFLTGTDEHGEPVAQAAEKLGITPRELGDKNAVRFKELAQKLNVTNDFFIRTTDPEHMARVAEVVRRIHDNGHVYAGTYEGWYCPRCADFKTDAELEDGNRCPIHKIELEIEKEDNWFFRLSAFQEPLEKLYADDPGFVTPQNRYNEALSFIKGGLRDLSLSRARLKWGVPVPWDESQVIYVWIDALLNYYTALSYAREGEDLTATFWPATVHLIGKDILKFHAVIWPALLMAAGIEVPRKVTIHGYLLLGEHKMSKSLGNVIEPFHVARLYGADALRFYVLREVSFGSDGEVSPEGFESRYTSELANEYGNLASRTLAMVERYRDGVVPTARPAAELAADFDGIADAVKKHIDEVELTAALDEVWRRIKRLNRYVQDEEPWQLAKDESAAERLDEVLYTLAEGLRVVSVLVHPFMPSSAERLLAALGHDDRALDSAHLGAVGGGAKVGELGQLFPRVEVAVTFDHGRARAAGVTRLATVGTDSRSIGHAIAAAEDHDEVVAIVGRHPHETAGFDPPALEEIERAATHPRVRAIGETGLDYYRDHAPRAEQRRAFEAQLELAGRLGLPVVIHTRAAEEDTFALLREHAPSLPAVVLHCFSAPDRLAEAVEQGFVCSFAGNVTYPKATDLQAAARELPDALLLVETDSPYLAPQPVRGKPNEPAHVAHTARFVAELRGVDYDELERIVDANAARVFGP